MTSDPTATPPSAEPDTTHAFQAGDGTSATAPPPDPAATQVIPVYAPAAASDDTAYLSRVPAAPAMADAADTTVQMSAVGNGAPPPAAPDGAGPTATPQRRRPQRDNEHLTPFQRLPEGQLLNAIQVTRTECQAATRAGDDAAFEARIALGAIGFSLLADLVVGGFLELAVLKLGIILSIILGTVGVLCALRATLSAPQKQRYSRVDSDGRLELEIVKKSKFSEPAWLDQRVQLREDFEELRFRIDRAHVIQSSVRASWWLLGASTTLLVLVGTFNIFV